MSVTLPPSAPPSAAPRSAHAAVEKRGERCPRRTAESTRVTVVGEPRTPKDTLPREVLIDRIRAGDLIVFPYEGSHGWEFAAHRHSFLGRPVAERPLL
ncbi:hypothetical protein ACFU76_08870 [Streptomyces sp. NPDC057539]|uniref:hypothetical protein n=1 Tax=Streptomyces sp. NPDC057539 TaxID=3346159 RepID=UPI0036C22467